MRSHGWVFSLIVAPATAMVLVTVAALAQHQDRPDDALPANLPADFDQFDFRAVPRDQFNVLDHPPFVQARAADAAKLVAEDWPVLGIAHKGTAKAYPIRVLGVHEACNDSIALEPIIATY